MTAATGTFAASSVLTWYGHEAPIVDPPFLNRSIWSEARAQYFLTSGRCALSSATAASSCAFVSSYGSLIPSARLRLREVERRVGDLDRVVRDRDLALVLRRVDRAPARRLLRERLRVVHQHVRAELDRDPVVLPSTVLCARRLERLEEVLVGRDQVDVHLGDRAGIDQAQARVARGRDDVVLAAAAGGHQVEHVVRAARRTWRSPCTPSASRTGPPTASRHSPPTRSSSARPRPCRRTSGRHSPSTRPPRGLRAPRRAPQTPRARSESASRCLLLDCELHVRLPVQPDPPALHAIDVLGSGLEILLDTVSSPPPSSETTNFVDGPRYAVARTVPGSPCSASSGSSLIFSGRTVRSVRPAGGCSTSR